MSTTTSKQSFSPDWIQQIPSSIAIVDFSYNFVGASPKWLALHNLTLNEIKDKKIQDFFPTIGNELKTRISYTLDGLKDIKIFHKLNIKNKESESYVWNINPWKDGYGNIIGATILVEPIANTHDMEMELNMTKMRLSDKAIIAKIGSWEYNVKSQNLIWTPAINTIYGVPKNFKPTLKDAFAFYKEGFSRDTITNAVKNAIQTGKPWNEKLELVRPDGSIIWVNSIGRPKYANGTCTRVIGTLQNITDVVAKPKINYRQSLKLFESVPFGMALTEFNSGKIVDLNNKLLSILGFPKSHFVKKHFLKFLQSTSSIDKKSIQKLGTEKTIGLSNIPFIKKNGDTIYLKITCNLINEDFDQRMVLHTIEDITEQIKNEERLKCKIDSSKNKNDQLLNFAHMVSHNLKAHNTNFSLLLNFLDNEKGETERKKLMSMLFNASENLTDTIKGLREIVAIKTSINQEKRLLDLNEHIYNVKENIIGLLKKYNGKIINEIPDSIRVKALPAYLESILGNILTNAIKYKKADKNPIIILSVEEDDNYITLNIEDNGIGIDMEKYGSQLFGLYNTFNKNKDARGIGLYISKNQIEAMNGKITAESTVGQGSVFKVSFIK